MGAYGSPELHPEHARPSNGHYKHWTKGKIALFVTGGFCSLLSSFGLAVAVVVAGGLQTGYYQGDRHRVELAFGAFVFIGFALVMAAVANVLIGFAAYKRRS